MAKNNKQAANQEGNSTKKGDFLEESLAVNRAVEFIPNISSQPISMLTAAKLHIYFNLSK